MRPCQRNPNSAHVSDIGLRAADDLRIWNHAKTHGFVVVSKDSDFRERSYVEGFPPKVVWLDVDTAGTSAIADLLKRDKQRLARFENDSEASVLILSIAQSAL